MPGTPWDPDDWTGTVDDPTVDLTWNIDSGFDHGGGGDGDDDQDPRPEAVKHLSTEVNCASEGAVRPQYAAAWVSNMRVATGRGNAFLGSPRPNRPYTWHYFNGQSERYIAGPINAGLPAGGTRIENTCE